MSVSLYAELPGRRARQVVADVLAIVWITAWAYAGRLVYTTAVALRGPADQLRDAGSGLTSAMGDAQRQVANLPIIGDRLQPPFGAVAGTGRELAAAGADLGLAVDRAALLLGWMTALVPILFVGGLWVAMRWRFIRQAKAASGLLRDGADADLFALRALATGRVQDLQRVSADPAAAWRAKDPAVVSALATVELRRLGFRPR